MVGFEAADWQLGATLESWRYQPVRQVAGARTVESPGMLTLKPCRLPTVTEGVVWD